MAVHGGSGVSYGVIETLRHMRPEEHFLELVHRLDRETSGCLVLAKKRSRLRALHAQLRNHEIEKVYLALVYGRWAKRKVLVQAPIKKNELKSGERISRVAADGKEAKTRFKVLKQFQHHTLIEAMPITGRTHQIRVHAQYSGHPIVGDERYAEETDNKQMRKKGFKRLFLHASHILIPAEDKQGSVDISVSAPLDTTLQRLMDTELDDNVA